ncbi:MAG: glycosyltransferase [Alcanivorax sediminis]|uniref:glycosyltransferase n=1 Tax=Alcanivorax sediminis TaxID=2663008 RepID=UPI003C5AEA63
MGKGRADIAIINRSFWPIYPVIGEALLRFAEGAAYQHRVCVIMQDHADIRSQLSEHQRGKGVEFFPGKAWSTSGSSILARVLDAVFFMLWVAFCLLKTRPREVYVSTDPPVLVPFIVMLYARLFGASYTYHLQDIHPEATSVVIPVNRLLFRFLRWMDSAVMRRAGQLLTLTEEMKAEILSRSGTRAPIHLLSNPAVSFDGVQEREEKTPGFSFCGNAGRLQRIPLVVEAIDAYLKDGGQLSFAFAGGGVFSADIEQLAARFPERVTYHGQVSASAAAQLNVDYQWALLPIEDEVTRFAFPSKTSSYVFSGALILAVCGQSTSVAQWVAANRLGCVVAPEVSALTDFFRQVERGEVDQAGFDLQREDLKAAMGFDVFVEHLNRLVLGRVTS